MKKSVVPFSLSRFLSLTILLFFLTHPRTVFEGASQGLLLWFQTVLPTLLPFMVCSNLAVACGAVPLLILPVRRILRGILGLSDYGCYTLISGLLCGYPMGAKTCGDFLRSRRISLSEARLLFSMSNHPSPMFLLGYAASFLGGEASVWQMLCALYLPVLPLGFLAKRIYGHNRESSLQDLAAAEACSSTAVSDFSFDKILMSAFEIMVKIGGYMMAFSILAAFIEELPRITEGSKALLLGFVEITTGIPQISQSFSGPARGLFITAAVIFGGLSGIFQTKSVLKTATDSTDPSSDLSQSQKAGLSIRHYILWKLIHAVSGSLCYLLFQTVF